MSIDPVAGMLADLDVPVAPRLEFADALRERLLAELVSPALAAAPAGRPGTAWRSRLHELRAPRRRLLVVVVVLLLLLTGVAAATYLSVRPWTSTAPRGTQVRADFQLSSVYRAPRETFMDNFTSQALSVDGRDLYLVRKASDGITELLRIHGVDTPHPVARKVLEFQQLGEPLLSSGPAWDGLVTAPGGDLFVLGVSETSAPVAAEVVVLRRDGSHQTVVTYEQLVKTGVLPRGLPDFRGYGNFSIAASSRDRLWLRAAILHRHFSAGWPYDITNALLEIVDPNADGDWSDRIIRRVALPRSVPAFQGRSRGDWMYASRLVPEPSRPGDDRSRSVLLQAGGLVGYGSTNPRQEYRVYRIADLDDDGDALDPGEATLLYKSMHVSWSSALAERVDVSDGGRRRELVLAGVTRPDRLTLVPEHGAPVDVARSFPAFGPLTSVFAGPKGDLYAIYNYDQADDGAQLRADRLAVAPAGTTAVREPTPAPVRPPAGPSPMVAVTLGTSAISAPTVTRWVRPDGHERARAERVGGVCESPDGHLVFRSDAAVPREPYVYAADRAGGRPRALSERDAVPVCPFDGRHVILAKRADLPDGPAWSLVSTDFRSGKERVAVGYTPRFAMSPDGSRIAYVVRAHRSESVVLLDLATSRRRVLAGPIDNGTFAPATTYTGAYDVTGGADDLVWSPDGKQLAVVVGRAFDPTAQSWAKPDAVVAPRTYRVLDVDTRRRSVRMLTTTSGGPPTLAWSPDGKQLLVCSPLHGPTTGCGNHYIDSRMGGIGASSSVLRLVRVSDRRSRVAARGELLFAGWSPRDDEFAWADYVALHVVRGDDDRSYPISSDGGGWVGWSPDARFIAEGPDDHYAVVDLVSGKELSPIPPSVSTYSVQSVRWWP
jgi:hypothetical protein